MKKRKSIFLVMLIFFTGILIFKNSLLYREEVLLSLENSNETMVEFQKSGEVYVPNSTGSYIYVQASGIETNEIQIQFDEAFDENATVQLFFGDGTNERLIEQKIVREGTEKVKFYFDKTRFEYAKIYVISMDGSHALNLNSGTINICNRYIDFLRTDIQWIASILSLLIFSVVITQLIALLGKKQNDSVIRGQERDSNIELLRCICMLLLVAHHYAVHGGLLGLEFSLAKYVGLIFLPIGKICFLAFIAISMYFLVDGKAKFSRFLKCWLEVLFYSVILTIATYGMGGIIRIRDFISSFFVMTSNSHGFAASYLLFLLIYPFVLRATKNCSKIQARYLLAVTFGIQILSQIMRALTGYTQPVFSELTLFVFCYLLSLNLKRYPWRVLNNKLFTFTVVIAVYAYVFILDYILYSKGLNEFGQFMYGITADESSIFFIIGGYALFYLFLNIHIKPSRIINTISGCTFGILLIHDHNFLRHWFWNDIVITESFFYSKYFLLGFVIIVVGIFIACGVIDYLRQKILETMIIRAKWFIKVSNKMDEVLNEQQSR